MKKGERILATEVLKKGGIVVLPTDTIYGVSSTAFDKEAVEKVYAIRKRDSHKPCIILISKVEQIELFGIGLFETTKKFLHEIWPGKVSVIIPISRSRMDEFEFLHRGGGSLAFRIPNLDWLREMIDSAGPLISTSANLQGKPPAKNIAQAKQYFGRKVDFYLDGGELDGLPSGVVEIGSGGKLKIIRRGEVDLDKIAGQIEKLYYN